MFLKEERPEIDNFERKNRLFVKLNIITHIGKNFQFPNFNLKSVCTLKVQRRAQTNMCCTHIFTSINSKLKRRSWCSITISSNNHLILIRTRKNILDSTGHGEFYFGLLTANNTCICSNRLITDVLFL